MVRLSTSTSRSTSRLNLTLVVLHLVVCTLQIVNSASIIIQELDKSGSDTNSLQQQQQQHQQSSEISNPIEHHPQQQTISPTVLNIDQFVTSTIHKSNQIPSQAESKNAPTVNKQQQLIDQSQEHSSTLANTNNNEFNAKPANNMKAEKLLKGLSSFMNPSLNPAAYFVPNSPSQSSLKSQHHKESGSRKSMMQKTDNNSDTFHQSASSGSGDNTSGQQQLQQQQILAEPSALVNIQTSSEGIMNAPTRMARPQNYIFRWGRR